MDQPYQFTSMSDILQKHQEAIDQLYHEYQKIIVGLTQLIQEIPADILIEADMIESNPPENLTSTELLCFVNGMRFASSTIVSAISAKMIFEQAELDGELNARKKMDSGNSD